MIFAPAIQRETSLSLVDLLRGRHWFSSRWTRGWRQVILTNCPGTMVWSWTLIPIGIV